MWWCMQVCFTANPEMDNHNVVFGCLANDSSYEVLASINKFGTEWGAPTEELRITECGVAFPLPKKVEEKLPPRTDEAKKKGGSKDAPPSSEAAASRASSSVPSVEAKKDKVKGAAAKKEQSAAGAAAGTKK